MRPSGFRTLDRERIEGSKESNGTRADFIRDVECLRSARVWRRGEARLTWELEGEGGADESDDEREHFLPLQH